MVRVVNFVFILFFAVGASAQNGFWADSISGCVPLLVNFHCNNDSANFFFWTFGNGNHSTVGDPQAAYIMPGTYTVTLITEHGNHVDTIVKENYITVYPKPTVAITTVTPRQGCVPLNVGFKDVSPGNMQFQQHLWIFGDGQMSFEPNPFHEYSTIGEFNVSLKVTDQNGCENSDFVGSYIKTSDISGLDFTTDDSILCQEPYTVEFVNMTPAISSVSFVWNFGDGSFSNEITPAHTYNIQGNFNVGLTALDNLGCSKTISKNGYINIGEIVAEFELSKDTLCENDNINFTNTSVNAKTFLWDFGDGTSSNLKNPIHSYSAPGDYIVTLVAENGSDCYASYSDTINVENITADFTVDKTFLCAVPAEIQYSDLSVNAASWDWRFGNKTVSSDQNPIVNINLTGSLNATYSDTLIVMSTHSCADTLIKSNNITVNLPKALITPNNSSTYNGIINGCIPKNIQFHNESIYASSVDSIVNFYWDFDTEIIQGVMSPLRTYNTDGDYPVKLVIETAVGCRDSSEVKVLAGTPQTASFTLYGNNTSCASEPFFFIDSSTSYDNIDSWNWSYSDGETDFVNSPSHSFLDTGYCNVSLTVAYNGCYSTPFAQNSIVYVKGPIGTFNIGFNCENSLRYSFAGRIIDADRWYWDFGDGQVDSSFQDTIIHEYASSGDYIASLTCYNDSNGCSYYWERQVKARNPVAKFSCDTLVGCPGLEVSFSPDSSADVYPVVINGTNFLYQWKINNSLSKYTNGAYSRKFWDKGTNIMSLIVKAENGCFDTISRNIKIYSPLASFETDQDEGCLPVLLEFTNTTQSDTGFSDFWSFGDGFYSQEFSPQHMYTIKDTFSVSLSVTDVLGCSDSIFFLNKIRTYKPLPAISVSKKMACVGDTITFSNINPEDQLSYYWDFGDGSSALSENPVHVYNDTGFFDISLKLTYVDGCDSVLTLPSYIHVQNYPEFDFVSDTTYSDCYPFMVKFSSFSTTYNSLSYSWDFGDNVSSPEADPSHSYIVPGDYSVKLDAATSNGCASSVTKEQMIHVGGPYAKISKPAIVCKGVEYSFGLDNKMNVFNFKWDMGDGTFLYGENVIHAYNLFGKIYPSLVLFSDTLMTCDKVIKDSIEIPLIVAGFISPDSGRCEKTPFYFTDVSAGAAQWDWAFGSNLNSVAQNPEVWLPSSKFYDISLVVTDQYGCKDSLTENVFINPLPDVSVNNDTLICKGDNILLFADGGIKNEWFLNAINFSNDLYVNVLPDTSSGYMVKVTDGNGCVNYDSVNVLVQSIPFLMVSADTSIIIGETITMNALSQENASFEWFPDSWLSCGNCASTLAKPMESTDYMVIATDSNQCFNVNKTIHVEIIKEYTIDVPTVFTPNNDNVNDIIYPRGWGIKSINDFIVFNKWGEIVFRTSKLGDGWDGTYKGKEQEQDTYVYYVEAETYENQILMKKGTFNLIR